jgi:outer membrane protein
MRTRFLSTVILVLVYSFSWAQQPSEDVKVWTLRECIDYALEQSLTVKRGEFSVERSEIDQSQAKYALIPSLNGSASHGYNWGRSINPVTNLFTTQEIQSNQLGAQSSVTLFNGLRLQNNIKQTRYDVQASNEDLAKIKNDLILNVANLYLTVIFNKELLQTAQLQLNSTQEQLTRTRAQVAAGALPKSNELQLDAQVASNELSVVNQENTLNLSILQLKQAMQLTAGTALDVVEPEISVEDLILDQTRDEIFQTALLNMPEIKSSKLRVQSSYYSVKAAKGNLYPRLSLNGSITTNYSSASDGRHFVSDGGASTPSSEPIGYVQGSLTPVLRDIEVPSGSFEDSYGRRDQFKDNIFRAVSLNLTIPVFNGMQSRLNVQRTIIASKEAEVAEQEVYNQLRQNIENSYNSALAASKTYTSTIKQVAATEESYRMMKQRYEIGAANFVEYQVSENDYFRAKSDLSRAKYNFIFTKKILDFYQNKPIDF